METSATTQTQSTSSQSSTSTTSSQLGKDDFLKLLVAQLKYQDPLEPMDNTEFIAQTAQFSSLEQMQNINSGISQLVSLQERDSDNQFLLLAFNLLGKQVEATDPDTNTTYSGKVQSFRVKDGEVWFMVDGTEVPSSWISSASVTN